jgi:hypothetical protein
MSGVGVVVLTGGNPADSAGAVTSHDNVNLGGPFRR